MSIRLLFLLLTGSFVGSSFLLAAPPIPVIPSQPTDFEKRDLGSGGVGSVEIAPPNPSQPKKTYRLVNYIAVSADREWSNSAGVKIQASLLAFEEGDSEKVKRPFTLIQDGNIRLLKSGAKVPHVIPMTMLSESDQEFIRALNLANRKAAMPSGPAA